MTQEHSAPALPQKSHRLPYIDTLRGFAACWVFLLHVHGYWMDTPKPDGFSPTRIITFFIGVGGLGVDLFIVLSGFCLFYPLIRSAPILNAKFDATKFYRRRAYRLLPAYYVALAFATILALIPTLQPYLVAKPIQWSDVLAYLFLVQTFWRETSGSINGSLWSIALEVQLYLMFPVLLLVYKRWGVIGIVLASIATAIAWPFFYEIIAQNKAVDFDAKYHFPARWMEFVAGMIAAKMICHPPKGIKAWAILGFILTLPVTVVLQTGLAERVPGGDVLRYLTAAITFSSLVILLAGFRDEVFIDKKRLGILTHVGIISYSFYLLHQPILLLTRPLFYKASMGILPTFVWAMLTAFPITLGMAALFFIFIERPFLERGKRVSHKITSESIPDRSLP